MAAANRPTALTQVPALARAFLGRLFENEITNGTNDLRQSFFWITACLSMPGACIPLLMSFDWIVFAHWQSVDALRVVAEPDKTFYLGAAMIGSASVTALVWNSLLIDRRDALVLGTLPVRPATVVLAKLAALAIYIGLLALAMAGPSSLSWGMFLADGRGGSFAFAARGVVGHFVGTSAAVAGTLLAITSAQGVSLVALGPRLFARVSTWLQLALVAAIGAAAFELPSIATAVATGLESHGAAKAVWQLQTPPVWFLGLYESTFGTPRADLHRLAWTAVEALASVAILTVVCQTLSYRRLMRDAVEHLPGAAGRSGRVPRAVAALVARRPPERAAIEFFLIALARVERQRLVLAIAFGALLAWTLPTIAGWHALRSAPAIVFEIKALTLPLTLMVFVLVGLRVAAALPSDLNAAWLFDVCPVAPASLRSAMERLLVLVGVAPIILVALPIHWHLFGGYVACVHATFAASVGLLLIEGLLIGFHAVPCTTAWRPERARLGRWWAAYLMGFLWLANGMPLDAGARAHPETLLLTFRAAAIVFDGALLVAALCLRLAAVRALSRGFHEIETTDGMALLDLGS